MMIGKCPNPACAKPVDKAIVTEIGLVASPETSWRGAAFVCPACQTILSVQIDPGDAANIAAWVHRPDR